MLTRAWWVQLIILILAEHAQRILLGLPLIFHKDSLRAAHVKG